MQNNIFKTLMIVSFLGITFSCQNTTNLPAIDVSNMSNEYHYGDDFYKYVNEGWLKKNPIPDDYSRYGSFEQLSEENEQKLFDLLTVIRSDKSAGMGSNRQRIRDFYNSAMDTLAQSAEGVQPLHFIFEKIENLTHKKELAELLAWLHLQGIRPFFSANAAQDRKDTEQMILTLNQGGIGMTDRDYYVNNDFRSLEIRESYEKFIGEIFSLAGDESIETIRTVMQIETQLAESSMTRLQRRDPYATYNKIDVSSFQEKQNFVWNTFFKGIDVTINELNISQPLFFQTFNSVIENNSLDELKTYIKWNVLRTTAPFIGEEFDNAHFDFYGRVMTGSEKQRDRWKRALGVINANLGEALGQEYVNVHFPPQAKERMVDLVEHLRVAFHQRIEQLDWMSSQTKEQAFAKLSSMNVKIGYPDKWIDYSELEIKDQPYVLNVLTSSRFNIERNLAEIGQPVDRDKWFMSPQTVNAYYSPTMNEIVFPAAILQPPFFYMDGDDAVNFGAIGMVIGHEMTHGFDDQGRRYAMDGNLHDWWTEEDSRHFEEKANVLVEQYNNYVMLDSLTINGKLSLGENIADLGGLTIAYHALQNKLKQDGRPADIDGFSQEQRFFISYAQVWRNHMRPQRLMQQLSEGPHSPGEARVNGIVYNLDEFYQAFNVSQDNSVRYITPEKRAKIW
jgi:putative endopeptidase